METTEKHGYCTLCRSRCGTIHTVRGDRLVAVRPDPAHPTGSAMCMKGRAAPELVHSASRLRHPMRRTRPKGDADPGWQRIGWDEALDEIAARLGGIRAQSGAEAVAFSVTTPSGTPLSDSIDWIERFVRLFGSPNICYATEICNWHKDHAHAFTYGRGMAVADYRNAELILLWGHNPANVWLAQADAIAAGRAAGARMIVVDPRRTALAAQADRWLQVRPGSDGALALGIANLMIQAGDYDEDFVRRWTNAPLLVRMDTGRLLRAQDLAPGAMLDLPAQPQGDGAPAGGLVAWSGRAARPVCADAGQQAGYAADLALRGEVEVMVRGAAGAVPVPCRPVFDLYAQACAHYTPERVREATWVDEAALREAAALIGRSRRVALHAWTGIGQHDNATQTDRALACLYALTGSFDRRGGNRVYAKPPVQAINALDLLPAAQRGKALGLRDRPLGPPAQGWVTALDLYRAISDGQPYRVRALMGFGSNLLLSQGDTGLAEQALRDLEFYVHCDLFETPTARYADILLPVNTPWEREGLRIGFEISAEADSLVQLRQPMVPAQGEARSDNDIVFALAVRLGMGGDFFGGSLERGWDHMLAPSGLTVAELRRRPQGVRMDLPDRECAYAGQPPGRAFATPSGRVELYSERLLEHGYPPLPQFEPPMAAGPAHPLVLTCAKNGYYCHSQHRSLASLRRRAPEPRLDMHPDAAAARGLAAGAWARLRTPEGTARFRVRLDATLDPRVVVGEHGWWQRCDGLGAEAYPATGPDSRNYNQLISARRADPVSGSVPMRAHVCQVEAEAGAGQGGDAGAGWAEPRPFVVERLHREGGDAVALALALRPAGGASPLPDYRPGQHIVVQARVDGGEVLRAYSLTGPARQPGRQRYTVCVRHVAGQDGEPDGVMSSYVHRRLAEGDTVWVQAPSGSFTIPADGPRPLVMMAGGIGITPFMSALESMRAADMPDVLLMYANRSAATRVFGQRLGQLAQRLPGLRIVDYFSGGDARAGLGTAAQLMADGLPPAAGAHAVAGRPQAGDVPESLIRRRALFYLCGPDAMMDQLAAGLIGRGVPAFDIFRERFRAPAAPAVAPDASFMVHFARSGRSCRWRPADGTLLAFAERQGLHLPSGCRVGQCESCAVRLVSGQVAQPPGIGEDDPDACLTCQALPASDLVLDA